MPKPPGVEKVIGVRVLALCGESLLIEGLKASLRDREGVEIVLLDCSQPGTAQILNKLNPDIILFEMTLDQLSCVFAFLRTHTEVVLIGLDINHDLAVFLSEEWRILPTVADLVQVIEMPIQVKNGERHRGKEALL